MRIFNNDIEFLCSFLWIGQKVKKTKMLRVNKQQAYFSQIVSKTAKITISFFMTNFKNKNIILGFSFMFFVSVYPTNRTFISK